jgi:oxygen-independent coproporphyrinogen III oxidase
MPDLCKDNSTPTPHAVYVHVPFCHQRCHYCDFYSQTDLTTGLPMRYVRAIARRLDTTRNALATPLTSLFIGGGTPTSLPEDALTLLLDTLSPLCDGDTEFTIEANPSTISPTLADRLISGGINRVSLGAQSFIPDELDLLGRTHSPDAITHAVDTLRRAGIPNISLDLIFGIPHQTPTTWSRSLDAALSLTPDHISCYALSIPEGTHLASLVDAGELTPTSDDLHRTLYDQAVATLSDAGLSRYEISNFARTQMTCRHNLVYWRNESYLGLGPAAASYIDGVRITNTPDIDAWLDAVEQDNAPPAERESLTGRDRLAETAMLTLRLIDGIDREYFRTRFACDIVDSFPRTFSRYAALGAVEITDSHVRITPNAMFVANTILADLLDENP